MMKYLLVALVLLIAFHIWRSKRRKASPPAAKKSHSLAKPEPMVCCAHCGTHLPASDAVMGEEQTPYCNTQHQALGPR